MFTTITEYWWFILIGSGVFLSLGIGLISTVIYSQRRFLAAQEEKFSILQESEKRFRRLVEGSPIPTAVMIEGVISYVNSAVLEFLQTKYANEVLGKSFTEFIHASDLEFARSLFTDIVAKNIPLPATEITLTRCDAIAIKAEVTTIPITYDGKPAALIVARDITEAKRAEEALKEIPRKIIEAQEAERRRFARELHDGVNQVLFNVKGKIESLEKKITPILNNGMKDLSSIIDPLKGSMKEIQRISRNLRPSALDDLGLAAAIDTMTDEFTSRTHIRVATQGFPQERLAPDIELAFFRIVQEALNNIEKHSLATQALIEYNADERFHHLMISDNGKGIQRGQLNPVGSGVGLTTMRERAELLGGTLTFTSAQGKGTNIIVNIPKSNVFVAS